MPILVNGQDSGGGGGGPTTVPVPINEGGTGQVTAAAALSALGGVSLTAVEIITGLKTFEGATAATDVIRSTVVGDTGPRLVVNADGSVSWGDGAGATLATLTPVATFGGVTFGGLGVFADATNTLGFLRFAGAMAAAFQAGNTGDTFPRWAMSTNGFMQFGSGAIGADVTLYRDAANVLKTDDDFHSELNVTAHVGNTGQGRIGAVGPGGEGGISAGSAGDTVWYRSGSNTWATQDGVDVAGQLNSNGQFTFTAGFKGHSDSVSAASVALTASHDLVCVDVTANAVTINVPASAAVGRVFKVKHVAGDATVNNITIASDDAGLFDGDATVVLAVNDASVTLQKTGLGSGSDWAIIGSHLY